jgi:hypothetical protein
MNCITVPTREIQHFKKASKIIFHDPDKGKKFKDLYEEKPNKNKIHDYNPRTAQRLGLHLSEYASFYKWETTLTYPADFPCDGTIVREHRHAIIRKLKKQSIREYTTVLEFQERGAPHIHILHDRYVPYDWLAEQWFNTVKSGDPKHLKAGTCENPINDETLTRIYMASYARKKDQKLVPENYTDVGKFWTSNRSTKPSEIEVCEYSTVREMNRESRNIGRWRKAVKRKAENKTRVFNGQVGKFKYKKWKVKTGKGFLAWGDNIKASIDRLKAQGDNSTPF